MDLYKVLDQVVELLRSRKRVTYRMLGRQFNLDNTALDDLKEELLFAHPHIRDEEGRGLIWTDDKTTTPETTSSFPPSTPQAAPQKTSSLPMNPLSTTTTFEAERRQLTVMFCDLVDSTALSSQLDPEDLREVIKGYQTACTQVIKRYDGHTAQLLGDGLLVYFGYPQAHEDDAQRAIHAGLGMLDAVGILNQHLEGEPGVRLAIRVGIHTGLVVVGEMGGEGRQEQLALGETPNVAARIQSLAEPDSVVISSTTHQLAQGYFEDEVLGEHMLRGVAEPMVVYRVLRASGVQSRLDVATTKGLTPLVGRESEVALLLDRWGQVQAGLGQVVLLSGEAGIGKSRLVQVVKNHLVDTPHTQLECRCSPYYQHTALYPIIDLVERVLHFQRDETHDAKLKKLERALSQYRPALHETVPLFATLLSLPLPEAQYAPLALTPEGQRQKTLEALLAIVLELAERSPVIFILEDLHWIDPSTLEFLHLLIPQVSTAAILIMVTYRPDSQPPLEWQAHCTSLALQRLPPADVATMVAQMTGGKPLPPEVLQHVVTNTDGIPLFVEELTKTILESGLLRETEEHITLTGPIPALVIPTTLHDALMARLDRLSTVKAVAQLGATMGRTFTYDLLQAVVPFDEATLQQGLGQLVESELLSQQGLLPRATYRFKHALLQEAAYQSLLKSTRQQYHQRIAQVLEVQFPETVATQPELFAHHYTEAGLGPQALAYWQRAGRRALERSAHVEAVSHLTKGLEVLKTLPNTRERSQQELELQLTLGIPLSATRGYAAPEVAHVYTQAQELCQQMGETPQLIPALLGLWRFYLLRSELVKARELAERCLLLVQRLNDHDPGRLIVAHDVLGETLFFLGDFAQARIHLEQAVALYDPQKRRQHRALTDPGVSSLSILAGTLWMLGYPEQANQKITEALRLAEALTHPHILASTLIISTHVCQLRQEIRTTQGQAAAVMGLATEQGFPFWLAEATIFGGWALAMQGQGSDGIAQIHQGLATRQAIGLELAQPVYLSMLAQAYKSVGQPTEGLAVLADAVRRIGATGECWREAEMHRLRGDLLLTVSAANDCEAESCFRQSLAITRHQQAKSLELRAASSLARLWQSQGRCQEAYNLLAPVYGWFTEGFDTADLTEAKQLLGELNTEKMPPTA